MLHSIRVSTAAFVVAVIAVAAQLAGAQATTPASTDGPPPLPAVVQWHPLPSGGQYAEIKVGTGPSPQDGQIAVMHFTGWLADGKQFDNSRKRTKPFGFKLGSRQVIKGWDEGVRGMRVGGTRRLIIPPELGYGANGVPGLVPPNATLTFDIELLHVIAN